MAEAKRSTPMVAPNRVERAEQGRNIHLITAESSEHPEDFLQPEFYGHVAKLFHPFDHVEIRTDDGMYWAEMLVVACDTQWAKVVLLREFKFKPVGEKPVDDRFLVAWKGPHRKWAVIRQQDNSILHEGEQDRAGAVMWLESYVRTIGKKAA